MTLCLLSGGKQTSDIDIADVVPGLGQRDDCGEAMAPWPTDMPEADGHPAPAPVLLAGLAGDLGTSCEVHGFGIT